MNKPESSLKHTPLYALHKELGAKMTAFAGWDMPLQYEGGMEEHRACREDAVWFDVSHMGQWMITGDDAPAFFESVSPTAFTRLRPGRQTYTVLLNESGGIIDDCIVARLKDSQWWVVVNAASNDKVARLFERTNAQFAHSFQIESLNRGLVAVQGPKAEAKCKALDTDDMFLNDVRFFEYKGERCWYSRSGYTGEDGFEVSLPSQLTEHFVREHLSDVSAAGLAARDNLRIEAGLCLYGTEMNEHITPQECGLKWVVSKSRLGEAARPSSNAKLPSEPRRVRIGLIPQGKRPVRSGTLLFSRESVRAIPGWSAPNDDTEFLESLQALYATLPSQSFSCSDPLPLGAAGVVTSCGYSPKLAKPVVMASVLDESSTEYYAIVRKTPIGLSKTALPFIPPRQKRKPVRPPTAPNK